MDLVDEENVAFAQIGQRTDQVAGLLQRRPRRRTDVHPHLPRDQLRECRLAEPGRPEEKGVVERLAPFDGRVDVDAQALLHLLLSDELRQPLGAQGELDHPLLGELVGSRDFAWRHAGPN
jgi:hypothetical protein